MTSLKTRNFSLNKDGPAPNNLKLQETLRAFNERDSKLSIKNMRQKVTKSASSLKLTKQQSQNKQSTAVLKGLLESLNSAVNKPQEPVEAPSPEKLEQFAFDLQ